MMVSGTIVFTGAQARKGNRLNRMAASLGNAANRENFLADEAGYMRAMGLNDEETDLVIRRDWRGMIINGASIYLIIKIACVLGCSLRDVGQHTIAEAAGDAPWHT